MSLFLHKKCKNKYNLDFFLCYVRWCFLFTLNTQVSRNLKDPTSFCRLNIMLITYFLGTKLDILLELFFSFLQIHYSIVYPLSYYSIISPFFYYLLFILLFSYKLVTFLSFFPLFFVLHILCTSFRSYYRLNLCLYIH